MRRLDLGREFRRDAGGLSDAGAAGGGLDAQHEPQPLGRLPEDAQEHGEREPVGGHLLHAAGRKRERACRAALPEVRTRRAGMRPRFDGARRDGARGVDGTPERVFLSG